MKHRLHSFLLAIVFGLTVSSAWAVDTRPRAGDEPLRQALEDIRARHHVPGMAAVLFDREGQRSFAVGERGGDAGPVTPETRFRTGQVSLLFTGLAAAALEADGSLPAELELRRLLPEVDLQNPWSSERPVRLEDLLAHRAGLGALRFRDVQADDPQQPLLAAINRAWRELRLEHRPGEREQYSVVGYAVAAYLIEKSVGMPFERVLERMLFQPLELGATLGRVNGETADSRGHAGRPVREVPVRPLNFSTAGDIWMSADDLGRVGRMLVNRGRFGEREILPVDAVAAMESPPAGIEPLVPGSRRGVHAEEHDGWLFFTQTGALPGFLARIAYSPELGQGYAVLLNHGAAAAALAEADALLRGQLNVARPAPPEAATPPPADLVGWYLNVRPEPPPRRLYQRWLGVARAAGCGRALCFRGMGQPPIILEAVDEQRLRERGRWHPGWDVQAAEPATRLVSASAIWERAGVARVIAQLAAAGAVAGGLLLGLVLVPVWSVNLVRARVTGYHALTPRLLPLAAAASVVAAQVLLFIMELPALGQAGAAAVAVTALTVAAPVLAVLAIAAALAGFFWQQPRLPMAAALYVALAAAGASLMLWNADLIAFQAWKY